MSEETKAHPFLTKPAVIDWLQWGEFPDKIGKLDRSQIALNLISEYERAYQAKCKEVTALKVELERLNKLRSADCLYINQLAEENATLRSLIEKADNKILELGTEQDYEEWRYPREAR